MATEHNMAETASTRYNESDYIQNDPIAQGVSGCLGQDGFQNAGSTRVHPVTNQGLEKQNIL